MSTVSPAQTLGNGSSADASFADAFDTSSHFSRWLHELQGGLRFAPDASQDESFPMYIETFPGHNYEISSEGILPFADCSIENAGSASGLFVLTKDASLKANITVEVAVICGFVTGNITATDRVVMEPGSRVTGQIETPALWVQPGAILDGEWLCGAKVTPQGDQDLREKDLPDGRQYLAAAATAR